MGSSVSTVESPPPWHGQHSAARPPSTIDFPPPYEPRNPLPATAAPDTDASAAAAAAWASTESARAELQSLRADILASQRELVHQLRTNLVAQCEAAKLAAVSHAHRNREAALIAAETQLRRRELAVEDREDAVAGGKAAVPLQREREVARLRLAVEARDWALREREAEFVSTLAEAAKRRVIREEGAGAAPLTEHELVLWGAECRKREDAVVGLARQVEESQRTLRQSMEAFAERQREALKLMVPTPGDPHSS